MWVWSLGGKDPLEKEMATHSSSLAWRIPGTGEPSGLLSMGLHRVGHDWSDLAAAASSNSFRVHVGNLWSGSSLKLTGILGCCEKTYTCGTRKIWQESPWILGRSSHGRLSPTSALSGSQTDSGQVLWQGSQDQVSSKLLQTQWSFSLPLPFTFLFLATLIWTCFLKYATFYHLKGENPTVWIAGLFVQQKLTQHFKVIILQ